MAVTQVDSWDDAEAWLKYGWERGWAGPPVCFMHDGIPLSNDEDLEWQEGHDPCMHIIRLYDDQEHRLSVESNDPPTQWRASNRGWER